MTHEGTFWQQGDMWTTLSNCSRNIIVSNYIFIFRVPNRGPLKLHLKQLLKKWFKLHTKKAKYKFIINIFCRNLRQSLKKWTKIKVCWMRMQISDKSTLWSKKSVKNINLNFVVNSCLTLHTVTSIYTQQRKGKVVRIKFSIWYR